MMTYFPAGTAQTAQMLSEGLFDLMKAPDLETQTSQYCAVVVHPQTGAAYIKLNPDDVIPVHALADVSKLDAYLNTLVSANLLPESAKTWLLQRVEDRKGEVSRVGDFLFPEAKALEKNHDEIVSMGFFG